MPWKIKPGKFIRPLSDEVIDELVCQAMMANRNGTAQDRIRELVRLVETEIEGRLAKTEHWLFVRQPRQEAKRFAGTVAESAETR